MERPWKDGAKFTFIFHSEVQEGITQVISPRHRVQRTNVFAGSREDKAFSRGPGHKRGHIVVKAEGETGTEWDAYRDFRVRENYGGINIVIVTNYQSKM